MRAALQLAATALVVGAAGLVLWAVLPLLLGWQAHVVVGGSMQPSVAVGDVLLSQEVDVRGLRPGAVLVFRDPDDPQRVVTHRLTRVDDDGLLTTRGDANAVDDTWRLTPDDVVGLARLHVRFVGLPRLWVQTGQWAPLGASAAVLVLASVLMTRDGDGPGPRHRRQDAR